MSRKQMEAESSGGARWTFRAFLFCVAVASVTAQCPRPDLKGPVVLSNADLLKNDFPEGSTATYQCTIGYVRNAGSGTIKCTDGAWSDLSLTCRKKSCGSPGEMLNGKLNTSQGVEFGAIVKATCNKGYQIVGRNYLECLDSGWNGRLPSCEVVKCEDPPVIENGQFSRAEQNEYPVYNDVIKYTCDQGYTLIGEPQIVCEENGTYVPQAPLCKVVVCETPSIQNAYREEGRPPFGYKSFVTYKCNNGYVMNGTPHLVCETHGWSSPFPSCIKVQPTPLPPQTTTTTTTTTKSGVVPEKPKSHTTAVVIGIIAGVLSIAAVGLISYLYYQKKNGEYRTREDDQKRTEALL